MEVEKEMRLGCVMVVMIGREGRYRDCSVEVKDCCRQRRGRRTVTLLLKTDSGEQSWVSCEVVEGIQIMALS